MLILFGMIATNAPSPKWKKKKVMTKHWTRVSLEDFWDVAKMGIIQEII